MVSMRNKENIIKYCLLFRSLINSINVNQFVNLYLLTNVCTAFKYETKKNILATVKFIKETQRFS